MKMIGHYRRRIVLLAGIAMIGLAVSGILDIMRTQYVFISRLRNSDNVYDWTSGIHYGEEMLGFYLSYLALLFCAAMIGGADLLMRGSARQETGLAQACRRASSVPVWLIAATVLVLSVAGGMVANRLRTERLFERSNISSAVSQASVLDPWHDSADFYPQLILYVAAGVALAWAFWLLAAGRRWRSLTLLLAVSLTLAPGSLAASPGAAHGAPAQAGDIEITLEPVITGVSSPMLMAESPDGSGRMFVVDRAGRIYVTQGGAVQEEPFLDITDLVNDEFTEDGLFSIAFHPDYASNGLFFVAFTGEDETNSVMRFQVSAGDPNRADPASGLVLLAIPDRVPQFHNGGGLAFGPDGYLYISTGDEGLTYDRDGNAQSLLSLHGKILRIDPATGAVAEGEPAYAIPPDNPFVDRDDALPEIWAYGLRNPWRFSFDRETGDLFIADVGQDLWEEVNFQPAASPGGENYGWNRMEASYCFPADSECDQTGLTLPVAEYSHEEGCAVIGGYVYRGTLQPALAGMYLFADICSGNIWGLRRDAEGVWDKQLVATTELTITSFSQDLAGELYVTTFEAGAVRRIVATENVPVESPAFRETWERTDQPVASGAVSRSWAWGPWESRSLRIEPYAEAPGGERTVVYFDKTRMEITDPEADATSPWYVTNGLLVVEMITGRVQLGDVLFEQRDPANVPVAGDSNDPAGPTYATFTSLLDAPPLPFDQPLIQRLDRAGNVTSDDAVATHGVTVAAIDDVTGHAIAAPFWEFMNAEGPVLINGELQTGRLFPDPVFATGRPITEAYWADALVGGAEKLVLIQCFERRCLTYTPDNPDGWQVEAGNVGRHYEMWRYGE